MPTSTSILSRFVSTRRLPIGKWAFVAVCLLGFVICADDSACHANEWLFRKSYYSHNLPPEVRKEFPRPPSRSAYRHAYAGTGTGFAIRGVSRWNYIRTGTGGNADVTLYRQNWFQIQP